MIKRIFSLSIFLAIPVLLLSCASQEPVLYPNSYFRFVGQEKASRDIDECRQRADDYVSSGAASDTAKSTAVGGAAGTVIGGATGAVTGDLAMGAGIGAAAGAASGLVRGVSKASKPSPVYKRFVERCLKEKGYEVIGWE